MKGPSTSLAEVLFSFQTGGSERLASIIARHLLSQGVETVACSTHGGRGAISEELEAVGIPCEPLAAGPGGRVGRTARAFRFFRRHRSAVLHVQHFNVLSAVLRAARLARVDRIVVTEHTDHHLRRSASARRIARRYGRRADAVTVVHEALKNYLRDDLGFDAATLHVIPNGVDTKKFHPSDGGRLRTSLGIPASARLIGSIGRLHPHKDPMNLLSAFAIVRERTSAPAHLLFVGEGPCRGELEATIAQHGLASVVTLAGERSDIASILPALDIFVVPSRTEGLPLALLEAMSCGVAVIATTVGGIPAAIEGCGVLVAPEDDAALAVELVGLIERESVRRRLGEAARRRAVERFDMSEVLRRYTSVLVDR